MVGDAHDEPVLLVKRARDQLVAGELVPEAAARGHVLAGFAWHQGWNDRIDDRFNTEYAANMAAFIRDVRSVAARPEFAGTVGFVPTREFWRPAAAPPADQGYHWNRNAETYRLIGTGLGRAMLALETGHQEELTAGRR